MHQYSQPERGFVAFSFCFQIVYGEKCTQKNRNGGKNKHLETQTPSFGILCQQHQCSQSSSHNLTLSAKYKANSRNILLKDLLHGF